MANKGDWYVIFNSAILLHTKASSPVGSLNLLMKQKPELADRTVRDLEEEGYKVRKKEIK